MVDNVIPSCSYGQMTSCPPEKNQVLDNGRSSINQATPINQHHPTELSVDESALNTIINETIASDQHPMKKPRMSLTGNSNCNFNFTFNVAK